MIMSKSYKNPPKMKVLKDCLNYFECVVSTEFREDIIVYIYLFVSSVPTRVYPLITLFVFFSLISFIYFYNHNNPFSFLIITIVAFLREISSLYFCLTNLIMQTQNFILKFLIQNMSQINLIKLIGSCSSGSVPAKCHEFIFRTFSTQV